MNFPRLALAAAVAWIASWVVGSVVNDVLLADLYAEHAAVLRPEHEANQALGYAVSLLGFFAFSYAYAKGYESGSGVWEGLRYGVLIALMLVSFSVVWSYVLFRISGQLAFAWVIDTIVEFGIYGVVVGAVYRPLPARRVGTA